MTRRSSISKRYEDPAPGDGEALVRVYAAGVNPIDITTRRGGAAQLEFPAGLGRDTAGVVEAVGKGVTSVTIGSKVIVYNTRNGYSELVGASQDKLFPVPEGLGLIEAVSIGITYTTAWDAVVNKAGVQSGQTVPVQGASDGVGVAAVQIAKALGATAIGNASTKEKRRWVLSQGADHVVDYTRDDWPAKVKMLTNNSKGVPIDPTETLSHTPQDTDKSTSPPINRQTPNHT